MLDINPKLGIDLGSKTTRIYLSGKGIVLEEPTVIAVSKTTGKILSFGEKAKEMLGKTPDDIKAYKPIKNGIIDDYKAAEEMIKYFINKILSKFVFFKPIILTGIQSNANSTEKRILQEVLKNAGAKEVYIISNSILSAIGSEIPIQESSGRMIINFGSQTTDIAIISLGGIVNSNSIKFGSDNLDLSIQQMVKNKYKLKIGKKTAETIKHVIARAVLENENKNKAVLVKGLSLDTNLPTEAKIMASDVHEAIENDLSFLLKHIKKIFITTSAEVSSDIIDNGIVLTGGGGLLVNLDKLIQQSLSINTILIDNAEKAIIKGLGLALLHLDVYRRNIISKTVV